MSNSVDPADNYRGLTLSGIKISNQWDGGVFEPLTKLFNLATSGRIPMAEVFEDANEVKRQALAQRLYDYYSEDINAIFSYLREELGRSFTDEDIAQFQYLYLPVLKRIIDKTCIVYGADTTRSLDTPEKTEEYTKLIAGAKIEQKSRHWHRMGRLFTTIYVQPVFRNERLQYEIWTPNKLTVITSPDDYSRAEKCLYQIAATDTSGDPSIQSVVWTSTQQWREDVAGKKIPDPDNQDDRNPYGELPFVCLRFAEPDNHWGDGQVALANIEEKIDILLIQLMDLLIMQSHGQPVFTNTEIEGGTVRTGAKNPISLRPANPDLPAKLEYLSANGNPKDVRESIDWLISRVMTMYGLSRSSEMESSQAASGYAKMLDNWDLIEMRGEDSQILAAFEKELYRVTVIVAKHHGLTALSPDDGFSVKFGDYQYPVDPVVETQVKAWKLKQGLWTPLDDLMGADNTLNREDAMKILTDNLAVRNQINDEYGLFLEAPSAAQTV